MQLIETVISSPPANAPHSSLHQNLTKSCLPCAPGKAVVVSTTSIAGVTYTGDPYLCRSCPDPKMTFQLIGGVLTCICASGYSVTGSAALGAQSCVLTTSATPFVNSLSAAASVTYSSLGVNLQSLTILHYFVKAATSCTYFGGPQDLPDCNTLANLCVLQLYDSANSVCAALSSVINTRGTRDVNGILTWSNSVPWTSFPDTGSSVCFDTSFGQHNRHIDHPSSSILSSYCIL